MSPAATVRPVDDLESRRLAKACTALLDEFRQWLLAQRPNHDAAGLIADAATFLGWDTDYGSGALTLFDRHDIDEYLLEWCPRRLSFPPEDWLGIVHGLVAYLEFLGASGHWRGPASQARALARHAEEQTEAYLAAMADPSKYGMAKGMFMGPALAGADVDFDDPSSLQAAMDRFNSLPFDERVALTDPFMQPPGVTNEEEYLRRARASFDVPPVRMPNAAAIAAGAEASKLRAAVVALREYLGDKGVALTSTGNLKLVDCRALVERLETGDRFEYGPPGASSQVRSMNELPHLAYLFDLAKETGATRVVKGRLLPVKRWPHDPLAAATKLATATLQLVPTSQRWSFVVDVDGLLAGGLPYLLAPAMGYGVPLTFDEMVPIAVAAIESSGVPGWLQPDTLAMAARSSLRDHMRRLALAGMVDVVEEEVRITPFGVAVLVDYMREAGFHITELPSLESLDADELLASIVDATVFGPVPAWAAWQPGWDDTAKCAALVAALVRQPPEQRNAHQRYGAFALLSVASAAAAEPALRRLLGGPYAGYAIAGLSDHGIADLVDDDMPVEVLESIAGLEATLLPWVDERYLDTVVDGPAAVVAATDELLDGTGPDVLHALALIPASEVPDVLAAISAAHPSKRVAKAARTALHRWRSRWSG